MRGPLVWCTTSHCSDPGGNTLGRWRKLWGPKLYMGAWVGDQVLGLYGGGFTLGKSHNSAQRKKSCSDLGGDACVGKPVSNLDGSCATCWVWVHGVGVNGGVEGGLGGNFEGL